MSKRIEVFKAGTHTAMNGKTATWTNADLKAIADRYNGQKEHEAPVVVGHPKDNDPAYGWVESLEAVGDTLFANLKDLSAEFMEAVKARKYPKRSISLYADKLLRHVGFLGAVPPAVKGLAEVSFKEFRTDEVPADFEFSFAEPEGDAKDKRIKELEDRLAAAEKADKKNSFSEGEDMDEKDKKIRELELKLKQQEHNSFCEALEKEGRLTPAMKPAMLQFLEAADSLGTYEFADGKKEDVTALFKKFCESLPKQVELNEFADKKKAAADKPAASGKYVSGASEESKTVHDKALEFMAANTSLDYITAARMATAEIGGA